MFFNTDLGSYLSERLSGPSISGPSSAVNESGKSDSLAAMFPGLAYGRHRGPARRGCRQAAVAISLYQDTQQRWLIPLTRRPMTLKHHGGQICLPGGRLEAGESANVAALREFEEELGIRPQVQRCCGGLHPQYVYVSDNAVQPMVYIIDRPPSPWLPDPVEVEDVILLPLEELLRPSRRGVFRMNKRVHFTQANPHPANESGFDTLEFNAPAFEYGGNRIWGATAMILDELARILLPLRAG
ncbi:putative NUDIX hydrolase [Novipirellula galeiformis]|uniref:Putative NUDIX hydrolase n=1 Tax=Novipirellula galeiformis TaxID=2528004 RepID=A0A5C6CDR3_9BACT|nr:CoA pyrophosphatase [Novipirellula galeiformis]TWU23033.1 putative NUDIX hydrolase [Novipirellula galeiformis]